MEGNEILREEVWAAMPLIMATPAWTSLPEHSLNSFGHW